VAQTAHRVTRGEFPNMKSLLYLFCGVALLALSPNPAAAYGGVPGLAVPPVPPVPRGPPPPPQWMAPWGHGAVPAVRAKPSSRDAPEAPRPRLEAIRGELAQRERALVNERRRSEALVKERNHWRAEAAKLRSTALDQRAAGLAGAPRAGGGDAAEAGRLEMALSATRQTLVVANRTIDELVAERDRLRQRLEQTAARAEEVTLALRQARARTTLLESELARATGNTKALAIAGESLRQEIERLRAALDTVEGATADWGRGMPEMAGERAPVKALLKRDMADAGKADIRSE